ncbi:hypothetical protein [Micavibrio aeruginosavorus]|uniref:hypothetical protein n=1 Tax=Micavibrio aeruginosavorus TaxID=349221 RepID=UPI003F4ACE23
MTTTPALEEWNHQIIMLAQAMIGAISPNFRQVTLSHEKSEWVLEFYLENNISEDVEEIEDIAFQYEAYQDSNLKYRSELTVGHGPLPENSVTKRTVYRRKETI